MQLSGMLHGSHLLNYVNFPATETLGPGVSESEIQTILERCGMVFVKPSFRGGVGKKGKAGLVGKVTGGTVRLNSVEASRVYL